MLAEDDIGLRESLEKPIVNHRLALKAEILQPLPGDPQAGE